MADASSRRPSSVCTSTGTCMRCRIRGVARRQGIYTIHLQCNVYKRKIRRYSHRYLNQHLRAVWKDAPLYHQQAMAASPDQDDWLKTLKSLDRDWPDNRLGAGWRQLGAARRLRQRKMAMGKFYVGCGFVRRPCCEIHNILPSPTRRGQSDKFIMYCSLNL